MAGKFTSNLAGRCLWSPGLFLTDCFWLQEGDPGIQDVEVTGNVFDGIGSPAVEINAGVPAGRGIVVKDNKVIK